MHRKGREGGVFNMKPHHAGEIDGADDIDIVHDERLLRTRAALEKEPCGMFQAATGVKQNFLARQFNPHAEVVVGPQVLDDHVGVVMGVDNDLAHAESSQAAESDFQKRAAGNRDERLGAIVGERPQTRAEAGGKNHRLHRPIFSNSICRTTTSTPFMPRKCFANCSAR